MNLLDADSFDRARRWLQTHARPLDWALFQHRFENAPVERVTDALARYRNQDGGFGHALEPDLRTPTSSALATGIALRYLQELGCPAEHPLVRGAARYLQETIDPEAWVWRVAPADTNAHPHAPWWHDDAGSLARTFDDFLVIPRAELVGLLHTYAPLVPGDWLAELTERTVADIETIEPFGTGGGDDLAYAIRLAETGALAQPFRGRLARRIRSVVPEVVARDEQRWGSYCIAPLKVAPTPESMVADLVAEDLQRYLDYLIEQQTPAGTWDPVWTWGEFYPQDWELARREWQGELTLRYLTSLQAYGRLAGYRPA